MINLLGTPYEEVGDSKMDLILSTKGKIKIRYGNTFIDLLDENGKINKELLP